MIDLGIYEIQKDESTGKIYMNEQLTGIHKEFGNIKELVEHLEKDLNQI